MSKKAVPSIDQFMTPAPMTVGSDQTVAQAMKIMIEHDVRHLPVLHGGVLVGIVSDRDLKVARSLMGADPDRIVVGDVSAGDVYAVPPGTPLTEVAQAMAESKYGCAVVAVQGKPTGIFTTVDAMRALVDAYR